MPRLGNRVPKYRLHKQSGQAIVTVNGRDFLLGLHGTKASKLEYRGLIAGWLSAGRSRSYGAPEHVVSITELVVDYVEYVKAYYGIGPNSELHRVTPAVRPLRALYGRSPAGEVGPLPFKAVRQKVLGPADDAQVDATLAHLPDVIADMVRIQRLTGMRPCEICIMRPCDIDRAGEGWGYRPRSHKTEHCGHKRVIFIGPQAQSILLRYLARDPEAHCFRPVDSEAKRLAVRNANRKTPLCCGNTRGTNRKRSPQRSAGG